MATHSNRRVGAEDPPQKKPFHPVFFGGFLLCFVLSTFQQYIVYRPRIGIPLEAIVAVTFSISIIICCVYGENKNEVLKLLFAIDDFFACWVMSLLGLVGVVAVFSPLEDEGLEGTLSSFIIIANLFFCIGACRVLFKYAEWEPWQSSLSKICLFIILIKHIL